MVFGIPKKFIFLSLLLFAFNMYVAVYTYRPHADDNTYTQILMYALPLLGAVMGGSLLGFLMMFLPAPKDMRPEVKYTRAKILGVLVANALFFLFYIYTLYHFVFITNG